MQPARAPRAHDDRTTRAHLRANVQAAGGGDRHPGDWRLHYYAVHDSPGDFTPVRPPDVIEAEFLALRRAARAPRRDTRP
jgi:hypothetical protein